MAKSKIKKIIKRIIKKTIVKPKEVVKVQPRRVQGEVYWERRSLSDTEFDWGIVGASDWIDDYWGSQEHSHRPLIIEALDRIKESVGLDSLLEVGCNCGPNLSQINSKFPEVKLWGVDINEDAVKRASMLSGVTVRVANFNKKLPFEDNSFDVVLADAVLMYVSPEQIQKTLKEINRVAKKAVIVVDWFDESKLGVLRDGHWARNYTKLFEDMDLKVEANKITQDQWKNDKWERNGWFFVAQAR